MRRRDDEGTVLVLLLGFTAVLMLMVAVVVNVSSVVLAKRGLASATDGAAVAAAQAVDVDGVYAGRVTGRLPLDLAEARTRVAGYQAEAAAGQPGLRLAVELSPDGTTAVVRGLRMVELPFGRILGFEPVRVEAEARARAPVLPG